MRSRKFQQCTGMEATSQPLDPQPGYFDGLYAARAHAEASKPRSLSLEGVTVTHTSYNALTARAVAAERKQRFITRACALGAAVATAAAALYIAPQREVNKVDETIAWASAGATENHSPAAVTKAALTEGIAKLPAYIEKGQDALADTLPKYSFYLK